MLTLINRIVPILVFISFVNSKLFSQETNHQEVKSDSISLGYGHIRKSTITQAIANVTAEHFNKGMFTSGSQIIEGKIAGLQVIPFHNPSGDVWLRLRGASLRIAPLIVLDGVPLDMAGGARNPLNILHPSDIQDITVLKDASTTAVYGIRGAGGVLLINSKRGDTSKLRISYDGSYGLSFLTRKPDFLNSAEYREAIEVYTPQSVNQLGDSDTDWVKEVTQVAQSTQHTISLSQQKKNTRFYSALNYFNHEGVLRFTQNQKVNVLFNIEQKLLNDALTVRFFTKNNYTKDEDGVNVFETAAAFDPTQTVKTNGNYFQWPNSLAPGNPVATQSLSENTGNAWRTFSSLCSQYALPFAKGLSIGADYAYDYNDDEYISVYFPESREAASIGGTLFTSERRATGKFLNVYTHFEKELNKHYFNIRGGFNTQNFINDLVTTSGTQLEYFNGEYKATNNQPRTSFSREYAVVSLIGTFTYSFADKYSINSSIRRDESSMFNSAGLFPAVSVGWQVLKENFAANWSPKINEIKLRAGVGRAGFDQFQGTPVEVADINLNAQKNTSLNVGLDAVFLNGKLTSTLDYYTRKDTDMIFSLPIPNGSLLTNTGVIENRGIETTITAMPIKTQAMMWSLSFNASFNRNTILDFPATYQVGGIFGDVGQTIQVLQQGNSLGSFLVYEHKRNADGSLVLDINGDGVQSNIEMYEDINNDGLINSLDLVTYKTSNPTVLLGLTSSTTYKRWDLSVILRGAFGHSVYNNLASANGYLQRLSMSNFNSNIHSSAFETNLKSRQLLSNYYVQNASFIKVPNLVIGYTFEDFAFGKVRAYLQAQNLLTITPYQGIDPEIFNGIDGQLYPRSITLIVGASLMLN